MQRFRCCRKKRPPGLIRFIRRMPSPRPRIPVIIGTVLSALTATAAPGSEDGLRCDQAAERAAERFQVPVEIMLSIARVESGHGGSDGFHPWPWTVNVEGNGRWFGNRDEASNFVRKALDRGQTSIDIGCFQINRHWHGRAFASLHEMFDPGANAAYAARYLKTLHSEFGDWSRAVGAYHSRTPERARRYVARFETILRSIRAQEWPDTRHEPPMRVAQVRERPPEPIGLLTRNGAGEMRPGSLVPLSTTGSGRAFIVFN